MSFLNWFGRKPALVSAPTAAARHGGPQGHRTGEAESNRGDKDKTDAATQRKNERARLRELLYKVVRESMVRAGVLSSNFRFKVLATDPRGRQFIVMMDLSPDFGGEITSLTEIESLICQTAKARYSIVVSAVYWRANAQISSSAVSDEAFEHMPPAPPVGVEVHAAPAPSAPLPAPVPPAGNAARFEPVQADEVSALRRALASAALADPPAAPRAKGTPLLLTGYENTEIEETQMMETEERVPALGPTQYGELR
jgi:hypothetical protein